MTYDLADLPLHTLIGPLCRAEDLLARLDERVQKTPVHDGFVERQNFLDAAAALWLEGELVHIEDLVLHDAHMDIRTPTHELTRAHAVLRARRQIFANKPGWALSRLGLAALRGREGARAVSGTVDDERDVLATGNDHNEESSFDEVDDAGADALAEEFAEIDALLARSQKVLAGEAVAVPGREAPGAKQPEWNPLLFDLDWDEEARLAEWRDAVEQATDDKMPAAFSAAIAWEAWETIEPLQHQARLGTLLTAALLRERGKVASHLLSLNAGLRAVPREKRKSRDRTVRLIAVLDAIAEAAATGLKDIDRLVMAKTQMERRLRNKRTNSKLPALIGLMLARPVVSARLVAQELKVTQRAALNLIAELGIRELTGRGRYRAWGIG